MTNTNNNLSYQLLRDLPPMIYKESLLTSHSSLKEFTGMDTYMVGDMETVRFFNRDRDGKMLAISINIPYYERKHPEKMISTKYNMFSVFEYTKQDSYTTKEIDWYSFKEKFKSSLLELCKHCI